MTENPPVEERQRQPSMFPRMTTNNSKNENEQATATDVTDGDVGFNTAIELDDFETRNQLAGLFVMTITKILHVCDESDSMPFFVT